MAQTSYYEELLWGAFIWQYYGPMFKNAATAAPEAQTYLQIMLAITQAYRLPTPQLPRVLTQGTWSKMLYVLEPPIVVRGIFLRKGFWKQTILIHQGSMCWLCLEQEAYEM